MKWNPSPQQTLLVLSMLFAETEEERNPRLSNPAVKALRKPKTWRDLEQRGWVRGEKRGSSTVLLLGDAPWDFFSQNLAPPLPASARSAKLLERVLRRTQQFLNQHNHSLAEFVGHSSETSDVTAPRVLSDADSVADEGAVRDACLELAQHEMRKRVRLKDVRARVHVARDALDRTLLAMQRAGKIVLYRLDNPAEISPEDEAAALHIAGEPRHIVYLEA